MSLPRDKAFLEIALHQLTIEEEIWM